MGQRANEHTMDLAYIPGLPLGNTDSEIYLDAYGWGNAEHTWYFAYGKLYSVGVGGYSMPMTCQRAKLIGHTP